METKFSEASLVELDIPPDEAVGLGAMDSPRCPKKLRSSIRFPPSENPNDAAGPDSEASDPLTVAEDLR